MNTGSSYLMESDEESFRLETKTDSKTFETQAKWSGIRPGMRVLDAGCGPGLTSSILQRLVHPGGEVWGIDYSPKRIEHAALKYGRDSAIRFEVHDIRKPIQISGQFDCILVRFVLEYNLAEAMQIVENLTRLLKSRGILCLIDLDYNCLSHFPLPEEIGKILIDLMKLLEEKYNFDPYAGRKLYSYLYESGYRDITVDLQAHHLIYGEVKEHDFFNWLKKAEMATRKAQFLFTGYPGGHTGFFEDFLNFFRNPARFTYTPVILCKGIKPWDEHPAI